MQGGGEGGRFASRKFCKFVAWLVGSVGWRWTGLQVPAPGAKLSPATAATSAAVLQCCSAGVARRPLDTTAAECSVVQGAGATLAPPHHLHSYLNLSLVSAAAAAAAAAPPPPPAASRHSRKFLQVRNCSGIAAILHCTIDIVLKSVTTFTSVRRQGRVWTADSSPENDWGSR